MDPSVEALKQVNLVDCLSAHYGLAVRRRGAAYAWCSRLTGERTPRFLCAWWLGSGPSRISSQVRAERPATPR